MTTEQIKSAVRGEWLAILARIISVIGVPMAGAILGFAMAEFRDLDTKVGELKLTVVEMKAALIHGIEPRVKRLEEDLLTIQRDLKDRTADRFTKADAEEMQGRLDREIDNLRQRLEQIGGRSR